MRSVGSQVLILGLGFATLYPLVRYLPSSQCAFLHYEQADPASGDDLCGSADASVFLDLDQLKFPVKGELSVSGKPAAKGELNFTLNFTTKAGKPIAAKDLAIIHTRRLHLFAVDPSLGDYQHLHPDEDMTGGDFNFRFTPQHGGTYRLYAEMVPKASRSALITALDLEVSGPPAPARQSAPSPLVAVQDGLRFELMPPPAGLRRGVDNELSLRLSHTQASPTPVPLEKIMGAYCHLAAFDASAKGFAHLHPLDKGINVDTAQPRFGFAFNTSLSGDYRVWAQLQIAGREVFVPFDLKVP